MSLEIIETRDIGACLALRRRVFIEEQGVPEAEELDDKDDEAVHLLALSGGRALGTARLMTKDQTGKIGRVCVLAEARGQGLGAALIRAAITHFEGLGTVQQITLGAQTHALAFYERLGFTAHGPEYLDAGIPHRDMSLMTGAATSAAP